MNWKDKKILKKIEITQRFQKTLKNIKRFVFLSIS
jgi:hypothetical protein